MRELRPRILVVDDDPMVRDLIGHLLRAEGWLVVEAMDGRAALQQIEHGPFDLVVMDVRLPLPTDGVETVRLARLKQPALKSLFISGGLPPAPENPEQDDFVSKPFLHRELVGCIWELLERRAFAALPSTRRAAGCTTRDLGVAEHGQKGRGGAFTKSTEYRAERDDRDRRNTAAATAETR